MTDAKRLLERAVKFELSHTFFCNGYICEEPYKGCDYYYAERRTQRDGFYKWALVKNGFCYHKSVDDFCYESAPSSRTDEILKDTRFDSLEEAIECFNKWKKRKLESLRAENWKVYSSD